MTNAELISKIKTEIERLIEESDFDESANLYSLLSFLDTLQEPENPIYELNQYLINWVRDGQTDAEKDARWEAYRRFFELHDEAMMQEPEIDFEQELYNRFGMVKDFTLGMRIGKYFYDMGCRRAAEKYDEIEYNRQRAEEEIPKDLEEAAKKEYPCDKSWMTPDMLDLNAHKQVAFRKGAKWKEIQTDQLPSDLNGAAIDFADNARKELFAKDYAISSIADYDHGCIDGFIAGAKWQAERLLSGRPLPEDTVLFNKGVAEGKRLAEEEQAELLTIAHLQGADQMKEQMLKEAVEGEVVLNPYPTICLDDCKDYNFKDGDKVRVIVIPNTDEK